MRELHLPSAGWGHHVAHSKYTARQTALTWSRALIHSLNGHIRLSITFMRLCSPLSDEKTSVVCGLLAGNTQKLDVISFLTASNVSLAYVGLNIKDSPNGAMSGANQSSRNGAAPQQLGQVVHCLLSGHARFVFPFFNLRKLWRVNGNFKPFLLVSLCQLSLPLPLVPLNTFCQLHPRSAETVESTADS